MKSLIHSVYFSKDRLKTSTHHHDCHQLIFILKGKAEIDINGEKHIANSGNIAIFSRYENHSVNVLSEEYERFVLRIKPQSYEENNKIYALLSNRPSGFNNIIDATDKFYEFKFIFNSILNEYNQMRAYLKKCLFLW